MAFNPAKVTVKRARAEVTYDPDAAAAAGLKSSRGVVSPTVKAVTALLSQQYLLTELFLNADTGLIEFGEIIGAEAITELIRELEIITGLSGWYEKRQLVLDVVTRRARSPHADRLIEVPKDLPVADLSPWTERCLDPAFADEAIRMMVYGYVSRAFRPGTKFDYVIVLTGPEGVGKTTLLSTLFPGRSVAYRHTDDHPVETAAQCERIDLEEASEELFGRDRFNAFKDRVTTTVRGEDVKYVRGKQQMRVRAIYAGSSNHRYLMPAGLEGTRRILPVVMRQDDASLLPTLTETVWEQLISEALRRFDAEEVPVLSDAGRERQIAALEYVTRPDDDGELMQDVIDRLVSSQGWFQKGLLQEELRDVDPSLASNPAFGRAWRKLQHGYQQVSMRIGDNSRATKVFVPVAPAPAVTA
ncbi:VapE domain-containing protein [Gordonia jacobaea]|uniref:VapE domain-containing protein n=1 Tax=Gordonia jacobaea TaxID=122202 RepID=UPI0022E51878|nr:VapE domain-containing protein [Gordonia jacobaea]